MRHELEPDKANAGTGARSLTGGDPRLWHWTGEVLLGALGFASTEYADLHSHHITLVWM
jgi:hypothetical protein